MPRIAPLCDIPPHYLRMLEVRMREYYSDVSDYPAFHSPSDHPLEWRHLLREIHDRIESGSDYLSILEFGCGKSGFPSWVRQKLDPTTNARISITCQDVTRSNETYLQRVADNVLISPLTLELTCTESFDLIFSTHCFEHVSRPDDLLYTCINFLKPGGSLLIFSPRYTFPFYLSPSSVNLNSLQRFLIAMRLMWIRLITGLRNTNPSFVIDTKPACLNRPFVRDADAIHWVSERDIEIFARNNNLSYFFLDTRHQASCFSKQWFIDHFCKLSICIQKPIQ